MTQPVLLHGFPADQEDRWTTLLSHPEWDCRRLEDSKLPQRTDIVVTCETIKTESVTIGIGVPDTHFSLASNPGLEAINEVLQAARSRALAHRPAQALVGSSPELEHVLAQIYRLSELPWGHILIRGETGTGKSHVARFIHTAGPRREQNFVVVNCSAIPAELMESELFGHVKGSFTGATKDKVGLLEQADGGTVFLDEIDSMTMALQSKLLLFLEDQRIRRVGGLKDRTVNVRVICATNKDLPSLVCKGTFREDLYYRIAVLPLALLPLRRIRSDLPEIAHFLLRSLSQRYDRSMLGFTEAAMQRLLDHTWPGNVRELRNVIERALAYCPVNVIDAEHIVLGADGMPSPSAPGTFFVVEDLIPLPELERRYLQHVLDRSAEQPLDRVAASLGITRKTLYNKRQRI